MLSDVFWDSLSHTKRLPTGGDVVMEIFVIFVVQVVIIIIISITKHKDHAFFSKRAVKHVDIAINNDLNTKPW